MNDPRRKLLHDAMTELGRVGYTAAMIGIGTAVPNLDKAVDALTQLAKSGARIGAYGVVDENGVEIEPFEGDSAE